MEILRDRTEAGQRLARQLEPYRKQDPVVLALPRGGVPVAFPIAEALDAPLDLVLVRKIGAPWQPELALGAVADGAKPDIALNCAIIAELGVEDNYIQQETGRLLAEIERRRARYLGGRAPVPLQGRTAIVVDDGIATGATMEAALKSLRRRGPKSLVLAVPVAPPETLERLRPDVDDIVCLLTPEFFGAIGSFYRHFPQVEDAEVIDLLARRLATTSAAGPQERPDGR